jgi:hypothetical protein
LVKELLEQQLQAAADDLPRDLSRGSAEREVEGVQT